MKMALRVKDNSWDLVDVAQVFRDDSVVFKVLISLTRNNTNLIVRVTAAGQ